MKRVLPESTSNPEDRTQLCKSTRSNNTLAIPVVMYSLNIINWTILEIRKLNTKIGKLFSCNRMHRLKADVGRLYIPRKEKEREMIQLELNYKTSTIGQSKYLTITTDRMPQLVLAHDQTKKAHSIIK